MICALEKVIISGVTKFKYCFNYLLYNKKEKSSLISDCQIKMSNVK